MLWFCLNLSVIGMRNEYKKSNITINRLQTRPICNFLKDFYHALLVWSMQIVYAIGLYLIYRVYVLYAGVIRIFFQYYRTSVENAPCLIIVQLIIPLFWKLLIWMYYICVMYDKLMRNWWIYFNRWMYLQIP